MKQISKVVRRVCATAAICAVIASTQDAAAQGHDSADSTAHEQRIQIRAEAVGFSEEQLQKIAQLRPASPKNSQQYVEPVQAHTGPTPFEITQDDETLYLTLRRWSAENGYQLVWSAGKDFPVKRTRYEAPDIQTAVALAMKDTELSAYPLHACTYQNRVIRVLHVSQSCISK